MAEQPKVSDYFSSRKKNINSGRKRSAITSPPSKRSKRLVDAATSNINECKSPQVNKNLKISQERSTSSSSSREKCLPANQRFQKLIDSKQCISSSNDVIPLSISEKCSDSVNFGCKIASPNKIKSVPAYERFQHLIDTKPDEPSSPSSLNLHLVDAATSNLNECKSPQVNKNLKISQERSTSSSSSREKCLPANQRFQKLIDSKQCISSSNDVIPLSISEKCSDSVNFGCKIASPNKIKSVPAYERFQHLIDTKSDEPSSPVPSSLNLPYHMKILLEMFKASDTVISMLYNRKELCLFDKISESVQKIVKKVFDERSLNQIRTVYDSAYSLRFEKVPTAYVPKSSKDYKLIVDPNLRADGTEMALSSPSKGHLVFSGNRLIQRRTTFHRRLIQIVMKCHENFLVTKLGHSIEDLPPRIKILRWHPKFSFDVVAPVTPAEPVPRPEGADSPRITRASEAVALFREKGMKREALCALKAALANPGLQTNSLVPVDSGTSVGSSHSSFNKSTLNGVSSSLLEKIRAKEARVRNERMMRGTGDETRRAMISRLPEMVTLIWSIFSSSKKSALGWAVISQKIAQSHRSGLVKSSVDEHIKILLELVPDWIERVDYAEPHLRVVDMKRPIKQVHDSILSKMN